MKYSLMSLEIDRELHLKKPNFIHRLILKDMGYDGPDMSVEDTFAFFRAHGFPAQNGSMTFRDFVRFAKESGFDGVDLMSYHFEEDGEEARQILEEYGVTMSAVNLVSEFGNAVTDEQFGRCLSEAKELMDRAYAAGCRYIMLMPVGYVPAPGVTREMVFQNMVKGLKACVAYGDAIGMTVGTETLESIAVPLCSKGEMLRLFAAVPGLRYNHDTGNPVVALEDPVDFYVSFRDLVANVHFKDFQFAAAKTQVMDPLGRYLEPAYSGEGLVDLATHLKLLKQDGYHGFISIEGLRPAENILAGVAKALEYFRQLEAEV